MAHRIMILFPWANTCLQGLVLPYSASSGCYWNTCSFCPERAEKNPYIPIPAKKVVADLQNLIKKHRPSLIHLVDNAISPTLMKAISENPLGAPWYGFARMTHPLTDPDFCMSLRRSGCVMLKLGLESGDQGVIDQMQKGIRSRRGFSGLKGREESRDCHLCLSSLRDSARRVAGGKENP